MTYYALIDGSLTAIPLIEIDASSFDEMENKFGDIHAIPFYFCQGKGVLPKPSVGVTIKRLIDEAP